MLPRQLDQIGYPDLQALLGVRESRTLEYKRELFKEQGRIKLLKAVTALANSQGGDLIIGITEMDGVAAEVGGMALDDGVDGYKRWIDNILRDNVEPGLTGIDIREVACPEGRWAFVVRVPRSWIGPHRIRPDGQFYIRRSSSNDPLDIPELRRAFGAGDQALDRIEAFRRERLQKILAGDTPAGLVEGPYIVLHLAPLPSFVARDRIDIVNLVAQGHHMPLPFGNGGTRSGVNLLGICNIAGTDAGANGYGQLFRNGAYEGVGVANEHQAVRYVAGPVFARDLVMALQAAIALQAAYDIAFPSFAMLAIIHADQLHLRVANGFGGHADLKPGRDAVIALPEILVEDATSPIATIAKPLLDMVWNAYGQIACPHYDAAGQWAQA